MRIISKYKDYYDYLMGIYGVDNKIILDRRKGIAVKRSELKPKIAKYAIIYVAICGMMYTGLITKYGRFIWGEADLRKTEKKKKKRTYYWSFDTTKIRPETLKMSISVIPVKTDVNTKLACPIVLLHGELTINIRNYPMLRILGVQKWYKSTDIYNDISNWISKANTVQVKDDRTDKEKLQSAGFDKVTSFRNM